MKRSKLENYANILKALTLRRSMKPTHIMHKANLNHSMLHESLDFLIKQDLIEERFYMKEQAVYCITRRGKTVIRNFKKLEHQSKLRCLLK